MIPPVLPGFAAAAQADRDQKYSPDGYVLKYRKYSLEALTAWNNTYARCDPRNSGGSDDEDRPARRSPREDDDNGGRSSSGRLDDGDEKRGPDGYIMEDDWTDCLQKGSWRRKLRRCAQ